MDSRARLDHAVFHLTPTRTRCDLVAFCGKSSEKLASGLLQPFLSHLKVAKDEILKGGYSITLRPPSHLDSHWFTKATFQRFVRFVSSPEILERFVSIENEIQQIESSIQSNESALDPDKVKAEANGENSKARLQHALGSRRVILRKEQAMAYQRALVLGFDLASIDDLLAFAGCFSATRLHEACVNFRELFVMKYNDCLWMDELAAVKAFAPPEHGYVETSAIMLTDEIAPNDKDNKDQPPLEKNGRVSMPWPVQYPPYMYNYQNSRQQGQHPLQMMQPYPPYYPPNMQWSSNMDQLGGHDRNRKSASRKKGRSSDGTTSDEDSQSESSDSTSDNDFDEFKQYGRHQSSGNRRHKKKHKKKPSKTVVIRNINYITSNHGEEETVYISDHESQGTEKSGQKNGKLDKEESLDHENNLVASTSGVNRSTKTWDNVPNLLIRNKGVDTFVASKQDFSPYVDNNSAMDMRGEKPRVQQRSFPSDTFLFTNGFSDNGNRMSLEELESNNSFNPAMRRGDTGGEDLLLSHGFVEHNGIQQDFATESTSNKIVKPEDWSIAIQSGLLKNQNGTNEHKLFDGSYELSAAGNQYSAESRKDTLVDDSIMVQSHSETMTTQEDIRWQTDISMVFDQAVTKTENGGAADESEDRLARRLSYEPDDMFVISERDSVRESSRASFTPEIDFREEISFSRDHRGNISLDEPAEDEINSDNKILENEDKTPGKDAKPKTVPRYLSRNKLPEVKSKKPFSSKPSVHKSKLEMEDEMRRKMEELAIERQKRIAERSAAAGPKKPAPKVSIRSK
ncbi:hypothetical protein QQ045_031311 [Rhodiola kirilowii]